LKTKKLVANTIVSFSIILGSVSSNAFAQMSHQINEPQGKFSRIEQPLSNKIMVTVGGLGLIGLELWWFLFSKPKSARASTQGNIQEITITVDGGYEPSQIVVRANQKVRLNFDRQDANSCLAEIRFPDFEIAQALPFKQVTTIEFTPQKPGRYEFTCSMNMFRGIIEVL
jgi:plastocyanin domain-containing protein